MKRVYFVRHGEAKGNVEKVFKHPDTEMTELGHSQAKQLAEQCAELTIGAIVSSPLRRAQQTAQYISDVFDLAFEIDPCFSGTKFASTMIGKPKDGPEAQEYFKVLKDLYKDPNARYEDAENFTDMKIRYSKGLQNLAEHAEDSILVVTHETPLKSLLIHVLLLGEQTIEQHISTKKMIANLDHIGITEFSFHDGSWKLERWNSTAPFAE